MQFTSPLSRKGFEHRSASPSPSLQQKAPNLPASTQHTDVDLNFLKTLQLQFHLNLLVRTFLYILLTDPLGKAPTPSISSIFITTKNFLRSYPQSNQESEREKPGPPTRCHNHGRATNLSWWPTRSCGEQKSERFVFSRHASLRCAGWHNC